MCFNTAIIIIPTESFMSLSALSVLNECKQFKQQNSPSWFDVIPLNNLEKLLIGWLNPSLVGSIFKTV